MAAKANQITAIFSCTTEPQALSDRLQGKLEPKNLVIVRVLAARSHGTFEPRPAESCRCGARLRFLAAFSAVLVSFCVLSATVSGL